MWFLVVAALIGLCWWLLGVLMRSAKRSLSFDDDGVWCTHLGKAQGLVRWSNVDRVKEGTSALALFDGTGQLLLKVEYERGSYFEIRQRIMEGMAFEPPELPLDVSLPAAKVSGWVRLAFACAALVFVGGSAFAIFSAQAPVRVTALLCAAVLCGLFAFPRLKVIVGTEGVHVRKKTCPYANIRSVDASFMSLVSGQYWVRLTLQLREGRPVVILTRGTTLDSLRLQRILLWAMDRTVK